MKKRWMAIFIVLFAVVCALTIFIMYKPHSSVSNLENKISLNDIKSDEAVLVIRYQNNAWSPFDDIVIVNKNKQIKFIDLYAKERAAKQMPKLKYIELNLLNYDSYLRNQSIKFSDKRVDISDELLEKMININDYKLGKGKVDGVDFGQFTFYWVYGSGSNRKLVKIKMSGDFLVEGNDKLINKTCDELQNLFWSVN